MKLRRIISMLLIVALSTVTLASCGEKLGTGWADYGASRSTEGRDISYVEMCVEDYGKLIILLDATTAPITVANFLKLVKEGFYDGLTFHRIYAGFMIQGGCPKGNGSGNSGKFITGEFAANPNFDGDNDISHKRGVISMARSTPYDSASSQFFIMHADNSGLDGLYAAFGRVVRGMDVIDTLATVETTYNYRGEKSVPLNPPVIQRVELIDYKD